MSLLQTHKIVIHNAVTVFSVLEKYEVKEHKNLSLTVPDNKPFKFQPLLFVHIFNRNLE